MWWRWGTAVHANIMTAVKRMKGKVSRTAKYFYETNWSLGEDTCMGTHTHIQRHTPVILNLLTCPFEEEVPMVLVLMRKPFLVFPCTQATSGCFVPLSPHFGQAGYCLLASSLVVYPCTILPPPALCSKSCQRQGAAGEETVASTAQQLGPDHWLSFSFHFFSHTYLLSFLQGLQYGNVMLNDGQHSLNVGDEEWEEVMDPRASVAGNGFACSFFLLVFPFWSLSGTAEALHICIHALSMDNLSLNLVWNHSHCPLLPCEHGSEAEDCGKRVGGGMPDPELLVIFSGMISYWWFFSYSSLFTMVILR